MGKEAFIGLKFAMAYHWLAAGFALEFTLDIKWQPNTVPKLFNN